MASLRKRKYKTGKTVWIIDYYEGTKQKIKTIGSVDKRTAEHVFNKFVNEQAEFEMGIERVKKILLSDFIKFYLPQARIMKSEGTVERERRILNLFKDYVGDLELSNINGSIATDYRTYRIGLGSAPTTVNIEHRHLKAIFNWAINQGYLKVNPFEGIKQIKVPESDLPRFFEVEDIKKVRKIFKDDPFEKLVEFYLLTGCRLGEPLQLTWDNVDKKRKTITIPGNITKSKRNRVISYGEDRKLSDLIRTLPKRKDNRLYGPKSGDEQWTNGWVSRKISSNLSKGGFPWASCHTFRHTYISHLVMNGVPIATVKEIVGHSNIQTTLKYSHLAKSHKIKMAASRPY